MSTGVLLESRPFRPFRSSEEYLYAMREDLAEWLNCLYPELRINVDNFMDRLDTGIVLCKHANNVRQAASEYISRRNARRAMTRSVTTSLAKPLLSLGMVHFLPAAKPGTFFARDNVSNFIAWCRNSLAVFECLLFETDDLIMRKNEKHVILCLLEVARRGAKFGMLAPMLVQMERQIDREIAADNAQNGVERTDGGGKRGVGVAGEDLFDSDSEAEDDDSGPMMVYGPQPQIVTNDLKSLDEMVRDLVERCTCPSQFPMVRVSEGKYRIGDTKVLIFVRILRSHVMVRVGGGWDTLSHFLDKHDPCRCRAQHRQAVSSRLVTRAPPGPMGMDLNRAQVYYDRSPPVTRRPSVTGPLPSSLAPPGGRADRSRSPTPQRTSYENQAFDTHHKAAPPSISRRSVSPNPRPNTKTQEQSPKHQSQKSKDESKNGVFAGTFEPNLVSEANIQIFENSAKQLETGNKFENISDNGSEVSDEGYRSLGLIKDGGMAQNGVRSKRQSLHSQASTEDAELNARLEHASDSSQISTSDDSPKANNESLCNENNEFVTLISDIPDSGPKSIDAYTLNKVVDNETPTVKPIDKTIDISDTTGLRKTYFSQNLYGDEKGKVKIECKIPRSPVLTRRKSVDNTSDNGSTGLGNNRRSAPAYRSIRRPNAIAPPKDVNNTWSGRLAKKRTPLTPDTFNTNPNDKSSAFSRNSTFRASSNTQEYDKSGRRIKSTSSSLATSPVKSVSPLAQEILATAGTAHDDLQLLEKMKSLLQQYSVLDKKKTAYVAASPKFEHKVIKNQQQSLQKSKQMQTNRQNSRDQPVDYDDFTTAWVNSNGTLDKKNLDSNEDNAMGSITNLSPRRDPKRDRAVSRIPAPVNRAITDMY